MWAVRTSRFVVVGLFVFSAGCTTPRPFEFLPASGAYWHEEQYSDPLGEELASEKFEAWAVTDPDRRASVVVDRLDVSVGLARRIGEERARECARATDGAHRALLLLVDGAGALLANGKRALPAQLVKDQEWLVEQSSDCQLIGRLRSVTSDAVLAERSMRCGGEVTLLYVERWEKGRGRTEVTDMNGVVRSRLWPKQH